MTRFGGLYGVFSVTVDIETGLNGRYTAIHYAMIADLGMSI